VFHGGNLDKYGQKISKKQGVQDLFFVQWAINKSQVKIAGRSHQIKIPGRSHQSQNRGKESLCIESMKDLGTTMIYFLSNGR
jgi:1,4-alpha-glucan branching enzyme